MIRVWSDRKFAGVLDRYQQHGTTFAYEPDAAPERAVSLTMPVRTASWNTPFGLAPIFQMNLPEGALRARLTRLFAKATGTFDDYDLLGVVGRTQIGRIRYSTASEELEEAVPFQAIDEILHPRPGAHDLLEHLLATFATHSGVSGVQPKVMIRATGDKLSGLRDRRSQSFQSATHIVKLWDEKEYPELAANEYFCLKAAAALGLTVPSFELSDDGKALVIERFDLVDGGYLGFEDFCVLNALPTSEKYSGGYETRLFKRLRDFVSPENHRAAAKRLYKLFALNCAIRNGDAHLKNFGVTYEDVRGATDLAPVYDLVTTRAYLPRDAMALTLEGTTSWPDRKRLAALGSTRADLTPREIEQILEATADAMSDAARPMQQYFRASPYPIGERIAAAWQEGIRESLGFDRRSIVVAQEKPQGTRRRPRYAESIVLEHLREHGGSVKATGKALAEALDIPASTLAAALKRLTEQKLLRRSGDRIALLKREIG
jgi:serine/threonine-protein kinase HipA